jgi:hypothetical protein
MTTHTQATGKIRPNYTNHSKSEPDSRMVTIPARQDHQGFLTVTVSLVWSCPECGKPRGDTFRTISYDGALPVNCDGWNNSCGHIDHYRHVRLEAFSNGLNNDQDLYQFIEHQPQKKSVSSIDITPPKPVSLSGYMKRQAAEFGLEPMPLEVDLLIRRVRQRGNSGLFLGDAFLSAYRKNHPFNHALFELINLDAEAFRLFHQILHIRHVAGWNDDSLYAIEQQIKAIVEG